MTRAIDYVNKNLPGEVEMGQMNLIPFMSFPDVALQLRDVNFYETALTKDPALQEPMLSLDEIYVSLDIIDMIRKNIKVSQARFEDGFVRVEIYEDSVLNFERALGMDFGQDEGRDSVTGMPSIKIDLDKIRLNNILLIAGDRTTGNRARVMVNSLKSRFNYLPEHIEAGIHIDLNIKNLKYITFTSTVERKIEFESNIIVDPVEKLITMAPSFLKFSGLELESSGSYSYMAGPYVDIEFKASNEGLDLLNFLFRGILNLDEIEQIGSGSIHLNGTVRGELDKNLPVINLNGEADHIGFRIKSIEKEVTDISFKMNATNGSKPDLSESVLRMAGFKATFPDGIINANMSIENLILPKLNIELDGYMDLAGIEQMIKLKSVSDLEGIVEIKGGINGTLNRKKGEFLDDAGSLGAVLNSVDFVMNRDTISNLNGEILITEDLIHSDSLNFNFNNNRLTLGVRIENLLQYLLNFDRDVKAEISVASESLYPAELFRDTAMTSLLGQELRGLHFGAGAMIKKKELDAFIKKDSIPTMQITLDSFGIELPVYSDISNLTASMSVGPDTLSLHHLGGKIGESEFNFSGMVTNIGALNGHDSSAVLQIVYKLSSDLMRAEDFFTYDNEFLLPETYQSEYLEDFLLDGLLNMPVSGLLYDSTSLDFELDITDLDWNFRYYPLSFKQFLVRLKRRGNQLIIEDLRGKVGESNIKLTASLSNFTDSLTENLTGNLVLESDLLDFNELLNYQLPEELKDSLLRDSMELREPPRLDQINYPELNLEVDIGELRYGKNKIYGMNGRLRSTKNKIFYLDRLVTSGESGGQIEFNGQFSVANPGIYTFSAELELDKVNINDLDFEMKSGEETYTLKDNFEGIVTASGLAEIFITPDFKFDMASTTAIFNLIVTDGALRRFTPLEAAGKYLNNKDLEYVRFATLRNSFTLIDSRIIIPLMNVESTIGQLLIEGEQGLDNSYLYLLRVPTWLVKGAAKSAITNAGGEEESDQIQKMQMGKFLRLTVWGEGDISEVKLGDKRERYLE